MKNDQRITFLMIISNKMLSSMYFLIHNLCNTLKNGIKVFYDPSSLQLRRNRYFILESTAKWVMTDPIL